jgi:hypothetical protein
MPTTTPRTKKAKQAAVQEEMHKFKAGELHSGSKNGPVVTNPKQAIAISMSVSGQSKKKRKAKKGSIPGVTRRQ